MRLGKAPKSIPGLKWRITIEPIYRGNPSERVQAIHFDWADSFAAKWHLSHLGETLQGALDEKREQVVAYHGLKKKPARRKR